VWENYGPYHFARARALKTLAYPDQVFPFELADVTAAYRWVRAPEQLREVHSLFQARPVESLSFLAIFRHTRAFLRAHRIEVCLIPSYWPQRSLAVLLAAKSLRTRSVMMNESHARTAQAQGLALWVKRRLVKLFDAALVGGQPQARYAASLGLRQEAILSGYDSVDNGYFSAQASLVRERPEECRVRYSLPRHYFLSLGRLVKKKNLPVLLRGYAHFLRAEPAARHHLVIVGSGDEERSLKELSQGLSLIVYEKEKAGGGSLPEPAPIPGVHFYGFRQVEETPVFYALADAFVLPSASEEWGLVVNEAMASGLPVAVSEVAGCAEDLLERFGPASAPAWGEGSTVGGLPRELANRVRRNGFVFEPFSSQQLSSAFRVLANRPELVRAMGQRSARLIQNYSCEAFARGALRAACVALRIALGAPTTPHQAA